MNDVNPLAQDTVEREILRLSRRLSELTENIASASTAAAQTDVNYKRAHSKVWLGLRNFEGTIPEKEAAAVEATIAELEASKLAEATYRALQEAGRNLRAQLMALQTIAANIRAAVDYTQGRGA